MRFTKFEIEELEHKIYVLIDSGEDMYEDIGRTKEELESLAAKISEPASAFEAWELSLLLEEAKDALTIAETNLNAGFPEYRNDVRKLRILVNKLASNPAPLSAS